MGKFLTRRDVAREYPIKFSTLAHLACRGKGPAYAIIGKRAIYTREDIENWLESKRTTPSKSYRTSKGRGRPRKSGTQ